MSVTLSPSMYLQFMNPNNSGSPAVGFKLFTYQAGTSTKQASWTDSTQLVQNSNPIVLDANGAANVWLDPTLKYKFVFTSPTDTDPPASPLRTADNLESPITNSTLTALVQANPSLLAQAIYPRTAAEIAANVTPTTYQYPTLDIRRYGADPTGVAASDAAMTAAIAVTSKQNGGVIRAPTGTYLFANQINLTGALTVTIQGDGGSGGGATTATEFLYSGTASPWILMNSAVSCRIEDLNLSSNNAAFTFTYLQCGNTLGNDPSWCGTFGCTFGGASPANFLDLNHCTHWTSERCNFSGGNPAVYGADIPGYANVVAFRDCRFGDGTSAPINGLGQSWTFETCAFEPLKSGAAGGIDTNSRQKGNGVSINACWFGDVAVNGGGTWISGLFQSLVIIGCEIGGNQATSTAITLASGCSGVVIEGNTFAGFLNAINFVGTATGVVVQGNTANSVTNVWVGTSGVALGQIVWGVGFGWPAPPGHFGSSTNGYTVDSTGQIEQWGNASVTTGTPLTVSYTKAFPNAIWNLQLTLVNPSGVSNNTYVTGTPGLSSFVANVNGTAGSNSVNWRARGN